VLEHELHALIDPDTDDGLAEQRAERRPPRDRLPIPGTKRRSYLEQNLGAVDVELTGDDLARIDAELPEVAGERYDEAGMTSVNR
jgi:hypothetical protein